MQIEIRNHHFELLYHKAMFWKETNTLLLGDLHLGKITHFRKEGMALPPNAIENNFARLDELIQTHGVKNGNALPDGEKSIAQLK